MKKKKGFTLVELLVVIAILAVLATVSVVGYMGFTKKAKESNDASLTAQMNTALQANGVVKKNNTLTEAREDLLEAGIDLEKVTPTTEGYSYVWDSKQDLMFLLNENQDVVAPTNATISTNTVDSFVVIHNNTEYESWKTLNYSLYFASEYEGTSLDLTSLIGIDAGTSNINSIKVTDNTSISDVIINTISGSLEIEATNATVRHYGTANTVTIKAIANESYHEYGEVVGNIELSKGRVELESTADVNTILVSSTNENDSKVDYNNGAKVGTVAPTTEAAAKDISKSTVPSESKQNEVVDTTKTSKFAGGLGTEKSPYLISNSEEFKCIKVFNDEMFKAKEFFFKLISDIDLTDYIGCTTWKGDFFCGEIDGDGYSITLGMTSRNEQVIFSESVGNVTIKNLTILQNRYIGMLFFKNNTTASENNYNTIAGDVLYTNITIENIDNVLFSEVVDNNDGTLVSQVTGNVKFENINIEANFSNGTKYSGLVVGGFINTFNKEKISFINCINNGTFEGANVGFLTGNACTSDKIKITNDKNFSNSNNGSYIYVNNCINNGLLKGTETAGIIAENGNNTYSKTLSESLKKSGSVKDYGHIYVSNIKVELINENGYISVKNNIDDASYYVLTIQASTKTLGGTYYVRIEDRSISTENKVSKIDKMIGYKEYIKKYNKTINNFDSIDVLGFKYTIVNENGLNIAIFNNSDGSFTLNEVSPTYIIGAYDSTNKLLGNTIYKF